MNCSLCEHSRHTPSRYTQYGWTPPESDCMFIEKSSSSLVNLVGWFWAEGGKRGHKVCPAFRLDKKYDGE